LAGTFAVFCSQQALAEAPTCSPLAVEVDAPLTTRWPGLLGDVREAFDTRDDIDRCAHARLKWHDSAIIVEVVLPDGRAAARSVSRRDDVVPTLESLLLVPQQTGQTQMSKLEPSESRPAPPKPRFAPPSTSHPATPAVAFSRGVGVADSDVSAQSSRQDPSRLRIELSAVAGARIGDGQTGVGLGALSFLDLSGWLVGFEGRADRYQTLTAIDLGDGSPDHKRDGGALELAVLAGRRFRFQNVALDLSAGPAAAMQGTATFETVTNGKTVSQSSSSTAPRLLLGARVSFNALATVHTFVGVDGELGPSRVGIAVPGASRLPVWTLGLALGATVGTK
jgi:hypothetical protein